MISVCKGPSGVWSPAGGLTFNRCQLRGWDLASNTGLVLLLFPSQLLLFLPLPHTQGLSECFSPLPLSPSASPLSHSHTLPGFISSGEISRGREQAGCSAREDDRCMWIVKQQSYIIRPFFSLLHQPSTSQTQQLTHRHAPQQQMGIPGLDGPARPYLEDGGAGMWDWAKAEASFTRLGL